MPRSRLLVVTASAVALAGLVLVPTALAKPTAPGTAILSGSPARVVSPEVRSTAVTSPDVGRRAVPEDRYALAGGCYAVRAGSGGYVARAGDDFAAMANAGQAEPFHFQATDLGSYLLFGTAEDFLAAGAALPLVAGGTGVVPAATPSPAADWVIAAIGANPDAVDPAAFTITLSATGQALVAGADGALGVGPVADASPFTFEQVGGCADWPEIETGVVGTPVGGAGPDAEVRGLLEAHMHGMAFEFLGGRAHCGRPWHRYGVAYALRDCPDHETPGGRTAVLDNVLRGDPTAAHDPVGWPTFVDWPAYDSLTHEGMYWKWLERAWRGGERLFVNLLVDNTALCQVYPLKRNSCNEMDGVRLQAQRLDEMQDYIDAQYGGPGEGWFRIVTTPDEARGVINEGRLAVVMGIEVSVLFDCGEYLDVPQCTADQIDARLQEVYDLGVRQMELVNKFDNALTGVAGDGGSTGVVVNGGNRLVTGHFWDMRTCVEEQGHGDLHAHDKTQMNVVDDGLHRMPDPSGERDVLAGAVLDAYGGATKGAAAPLYPAGPHCNARGLTPLGIHVIDGMIAKGMIFDPDHMSALARAQALAHVEEVAGAGARHPAVISSHSWADEASIPRVYDLGGIVTPYAGAAEGFVAAWRAHRATAATVAPGALFGFGFGADMNGFGAQGPPRHPDEGYDVDYPFTGPLGDVEVRQHRAGERIYDINTDGVAHYGMYPDWLADARLLAGPDGGAFVADMLRGPEAYLQMWERAAGVAPNDCATPQDSFTADDAHALLGDRPEDVLLTLGQPSHRDPGRFGYCLDAGVAPAALTIGFDGDRRVAMVAIGPPTPAERALYEATRRRVAGALRSE